MHETAAQFSQRAAEAYGFEVEVQEFPEGTKTAADAAAAIGCDVAQIASSIVLIVDGDLVVSVTSGANRVDEAKLAAAVDAPGADVRTATPEEIKETLGWSIGGVPPFCHDTAVPVVMDETLLHHETVWAAAGTPDAVFPIDPERLGDLAGAPTVDVAE